MLEYVSKGWPERVDENMQAFKVRGRELSIENGCLFWGHRLIIPHVRRTAILDELHIVHTGIVKMKALARSFVWWPKIDQDIENVSKSCKLCLENS